MQNMKKLFLIAVSLMLLTDVFAQRDVTKFLGIPVDGTKSEMIRQLKAKGYTSNSYDSDMLEGEFNGSDVLISVVTNNNKVYRIMVADANCKNETDIRIRFNNLCEQFKNNERYISFEDYTIPDSEDISYEMSVKKKRYEAVFYQKQAADALYDEFYNKPVWFMIYREYGKYRIILYYDYKCNQANGEDL